MNFYAHKGLYPLGEEPPGTGSNRMVMHDMQTIQMALTHVRAAWGDVSVRIYSFTNFWDRSTYNLVLEVE